tara:strand:+ start:2441 stop:2563 length:123 start_codon:yes stop_codon:yes gene_type:complete
MAETFFQKLAKKKGGSVEPDIAPPKAKTTKKKPTPKKEVE